MVDNLLFIMKNIETEAYLLFPKCILNHLNLICGNILKPEFLKTDDSMFNVDFSSANNLLELKDVHFGTDNKCEHYLKEHIENNTLF